MLEEQLLAEFMSRLKAETADKLSELGLEGPLAADRALAEVVLDYLEEAKLWGEHEVCPYEDQGGRQQCRVLGYSLADEDDRLELFTALFVDDRDTAQLPTQELKKLSGRAARFFEVAGRGDHSRFSGHPEAEAAARHIHRELSRIAEVRVHVLTNVMTRERAIKTLNILDRPVAFSVWDAERLYRATGDEITRDRIDIDFAALMGRPMACLEMKPPPAEYQTFLLVVPGDIIFRLYEEFGPKLFELNVRSFLQAKGRVNKGIRESLKTQPERFLAYNNGLTATADEIEVGSWHGETVIHRLKGLQIVNGAQTTASIHRAAKLKEIDPKRVAVAMKLTRVEPAKLAEFVPLIAQYANTQNPVQLADLSANGEFHVALERISERLWCPGEESRWFYERTRGAYQVALARYGTTPAKKKEFERETPKSQHFSKTDLAKFCMSWWEQPQEVSRGAQKNFNAFMEELRERFPADWVPDEAFFRYVVAIALLFKVAQEVVRRAKLQSYGANVVTYLVAKLAHERADRLDVEGIWEMQEVSEELKRMLSVWAPVVHQEIIKVAGRRNVTEICKKDECWDHIRKLKLPFPADELPEFHDSTASAEAPRPQVNGKDPADLVARCMSLDGKSWHQLLAWASGSGKVPSFDRKVANTLAGYADEGWKKQPSIKQARIAARVLDAAVREGVHDQSS